MLGPMITALHALIYSSDPDRTRAFFRDTLRLPFVDAGGGWLIFALPPAAELGVHPTADIDPEPAPEPLDPGRPAIGPGHQALYLMCDDIHKTVADLRDRGVEFTRGITDEGWGLLTSFEVPAAGVLHLYQPRHPVAHSLPGR